MAEILKTVNLWKRFGKVEAVKDVSFSIASGEYVVILGPSGCGKTTLLRLIAGLYEPDRGEIYIDGKLVNNVPPHKRGIALMFQNYALFPHMSVLDNILYGLIVRKVPKDEAIKRAKEVSKILNIEDLLNRYPHQLSGGQQQRVALARALVVEPKVLLLDEPLSNLDAKIRAKVRIELRRIQRDLNLTVLHVTHDQEEALALSDKVIIMNQGMIEQIGRPVDIYYRPATVFVADFIGTTNFIKGIVKEVYENRVMVEVNNHHIQATRIHDYDRGDKVILAFRPEDIVISENMMEGDNLFQVLVKDKIFMGPYTRYIVDLAGHEIIVDVYGRHKILGSGEAFIKIPSERILIVRE